MSRRQPSGRLPHGSVTSTVAFLLLAVAVPLLAGTALSVQIPPLHWTYAVGLYLAILIYSGTRLAMLCGGAPPKYLAIVFFGFTYVWMGLSAFAGQQALLDVQHSPIWGIGFDHLNEATEVHLQMLAAGGILALAGYLVYWFTVLHRAQIARLVDPALGSALLASVLTFLVLNFVENQVADTYLYVPAALLVSVAELQRKVVAQRQSVAQKTDSRPPRLDPYAELPDGDRQRSGAFPDDCH